MMDWFTPMRCRAFPGRRIDLSLAVDNAIVVGIAAAWFDAGTRTPCNYVSAYGVDGLARPLSRGITTHFSGWWG